MRALKSTTMLGPTTAAVSRALGRRVLRGRPLLSGRSVLRSRLLLLIVGVLSWLPAAAPAARYFPAPEIDFFHESDPEIQLGRVVKYWPEGYERMWIEALRGPEADLRREVADTLRQAAAEGLQPREALFEAVATALSDPATDGLSRTALAGVLVDYDARQYADLLRSQLAGASQAYVLLVEPALARWNDRGMREVWLTRLRERQAVGALQRVALECLAEVREPAAWEVVLPILQSQRESPVLRALAAEAASRCATDGDQVIPWAESLLESAPESMIDAILGARLLRHQSGAAVEELLARYALLPHGTAAGIAIERLLELAPHRIVEHGPQLLAHRDSKVRWLTVRAYRSAPSTAAVDLLALALKDPVDRVRIEARHVLIEFARQRQLKDEVLARCEAVLAGDEWRGLEQATIVLTRLDHRAAGQRLMTLVEHPRPQVHITAAWGVKRLAIEPWMPRIIKLMRSIGSSTDKLSDPDYSYTLAHLIEAAGKLQHRPAKDFLVRLIPKAAPFPVRCRLAAIWSLGYICDPRNDPEVVEALRGRVADTAVQPMEDLRVRAHAGASLGRMGASSSIDFLREWSDRESVQSLIGRYCAWGVLQLDGTPLPELQPRRQAVSGWSLKPVR